MALRNVVESVPTEFDYFQSKVIQAAILNEYDVDYQPVTAMQPGAPIEFLIKGSDQLYLDVNQSKLEIKGRITTAAGGNIAGNADVALTNLSLHSLFKKVEVELCGKTLSDSNELYPYRAFFETLLSFDDDVGRTRLIAEGWQKDTPGSFDDFRVGNNGANTGFKARAARTATSTSITLIGRPHADLFHQDKDIPSGCDLRLRFIPAADAFLIKKDANTAEQYRFRIESARFWARTKELSPSLMLAHEKMLQTQNMRIPYTKVAMKSVSIPIGVTSIEMDNVYTGAMPDRILLALIANNRLNGDYNLNPYSFEHFNLSQIALKVNGEQFPRIAYEPNFANGDYIREYFGLLEALSMDIGPKAIALTPTEWATSYPFFMFRLTPSGLPTIPRTGKARLSLKFRQATAAAISALLFAEFPEVIEIDRYRNIVNLV